MTHAIDSLAGIETRQLEGFFAGWPHPPSPETHLLMLSASDHIVLASDVERGQVVVGFVTTLLDGALTASFRSWKCCPPIKVGASARR